MRRKEKERTDEAFFDLVFAKAEVMFLAFNDNGAPYCIPVNFARKRDWIYIHSAREGKKIDLTAIDNRVGFALAVDIEIAREKSTTHYKSVSGSGLISRVEDREEKRAALDLIAARYDAKCRRPAPDRDVDRVAILRVDITVVTGKCSQ